MDGSWSSDGLAGIGAYLTQDGEVIHWVSKRVNTMDPAQVACAVLQGLKTSANPQLQQGASAIGFKLNCGFFGTQATNCT